DIILPRLKKNYIKTKLFHRIVRTIGVPESKLAARIKDWEEALPKEIKLAYLPTMGSVKLRLTAMNDANGVIRNQVEHQIEKLIPIIKKDIYGYDKEEIEEAIGRLLKERGLTLATAESCTGGFLSHRITSVAGSSQWFKGGVIPYSNELKTQELQVGTEVLTKYGAVSEPVVKILADNVRKTFGADVAVSISGIAGPGGGTKEKPVGTVWIGYADSQKVVAKEFHFTKDRRINIQYTAIAAMNMIRLNLPTE
ncbi:MAG: nicotinamide-nucleotide amidohydrolase family protein, partial [Bacteroidota bacterium]